MEIIGSALVLPMFVALLLIFSIILFGRPKLLIPPALREHRGIIGEYIRRAAALVRRRPRDQQ